MVPIDSGAEVKTDELGMTWVCALGTLMLTKELTFECMADR